jgi:hypothetical protein
MRDARIAATRIREADDGRRVQKAVRREQFRADRELAVQFTLIERNQLHAEQIGQAAFLAVAQEIERDIGTELGHGR